MPITLSIFLNRNDASPPKQIKVEDQHSVLPRHDKKDKIAVKASTSFIRLSRLKNETPSKPVKLKRRHISSMKEKDADFSDKKVSYMFYSLFLSTIIKL